MTSLKADTDNICHSLQQGDFCYVLRGCAVRPPSSLCLHTRDEMRKRGYRSLIISTEILNADLLKTQSWDRKLIESIWSGLESHQGMAQLYLWLEVHQALSPEQRLMQFTNDFLLNEFCEQPTVIFLDSVDILLGFPNVTDVLWAWIEHCCELRDTYLTYHHLSFAVFGSSQRFRMAISNNHLLADRIKNTLKVKIFAKIKTSLVEKSGEKPYSCQNTVGLPILVTSSLYSM